jgi:tocopherol cyclase
LRSIYKIFHPEIFQGSFRRKNYFEGWYFKHVSGPEDDSFAVIPGISLSDDSHSFVQYIDGRTGKSDYFRYDISDFSFDRKKLDISVGNSRFNSDEVYLDLSNENLKVTGRIHYSEFLRIPTGILTPGIMGWYSYIPTMECNHGVVSIIHDIEGYVTVNGDQRFFDGGKGYIEKDWGSSFPESWLWLQCSNFPSHSASVMISVAKIPWKGHFFIGFIAFFSLNGKTTVLATYNGSRMESLRRLDESRTEVIIGKGDLTLKATITKKGSTSLRSPLAGLMKNIIKESLDSEVCIELNKSGNVVFSETGLFAGYEETEAIFSYF